MIPRINKKIDEYIEKNYKDNKNDFLKSDLTYKATKYTMKITNKNNKNHYFYIYYQNKKIKDTYKIDYLEGKTLLKHIKSKLEKEVLEKTKTNVTVEIISKLNDYTSSVKERIIKEDHLLELPFYTLEKELLIDIWNEKNISDDIINMINKYQEKEITPKYYRITITNNNNIKESITINQITTDFIDNEEKELIIKDILENNNNSTMLKKYKITIQ